jgi:hypothetical protein
MVNTPVMTVCHESVPATWSQKMAIGKAQMITIGSVQWMKMEDIYLAVNGAENNKINKK